MCMDLSYCTVQAAFESVASAARTANRVVTVTQSEIDNTEDKKYIDELKSGSESVGKSEL